jgi:hypothetical protein
LININEWTPQNACFETQLININGWTPQNACFQNRIVEVLFSTDFLSFTFVQSFGLTNIMADLTGSQLANHWVRFGKRVSARSDRVTIQEMLDFDIEESKTIGGEFNLVCLPCLKFVSCSLCFRTPQNTCFRKCIRSRHSCDTISDIVLLFLQREDLETSSNTGWCRADPGRAENS